MKKVMIMLFVFLCIKANSQVYKYYFIEINTTSKAEVELSPEWGYKYEDIDSLVCKREIKSNGKEDYKGKKYKSYSEAFNALSAAGLEFVQFASLSTVGGATRLIAGDIKVGYTIWRKKL